MTTHEIAAWMRAKKTGCGRYIAKCPSHNDRRASLTIAEGRGGRTLMFCWSLKGCAIEAIVAAAGLSMHDLFQANDSSPTPRRQTRHKPSEAEIKLKLLFEADRVRRQLECHGIIGELLTSEINNIRWRIGRTSGVVLEPLRPPPYEGGGYGGRDRDPLWPVLFEAAWDRVCIEFFGTPLPSLQDFADSNLRPPLLLLVLAEDLAGHFMREVEAAARGEYSRAEAAA